MKYILILSLFSLVSCEVLTRKEPSKRQKTERVCACLPTTKVTINAPQALPAKMTVTLNDRLLIDECSPRPATDYEITRNEKSGIIKFKVGHLLANSKLEIVDRGSDCTNDAIYYSNASVPTQITVISDRRDLPGLYEAVIDL